MHSLVSLIPKFLSWIISFVVLGIFGFAHHRHFHYVRVADGPLLWLNILYLGGVRFMRPSSQVYRASLFRLAGLILIAVGAIGIAMVIPGAGHAAFMLLMPISIISTRFDRRARRFEVPIAMTPNKQSVKKYMEAFTRTDHAGVLSCLTDDVEWLIPGAFLVKGKSAFDKDSDRCIRREPGHRRQPPDRRKQRRGGGRLRPVREERRQHAERCLLRRVRDAGREDRAPDVVLNGCASDRP